MAAPSIGVLHLLARDDWGGTEVQVAELVRRADRTRCAHAVALLGGPGPLSRRLARAGRAVFSLSGPGGMVGAALRLARLFRTGQWQLVEAYGFRLAMVARMARLLTRSPPVLVVGVRGLHVAEAEDPTDRRTQTILAVERTLSRWTGGYDANSYGARDFLVQAGFPPEKFTVIPNAVEVLRDRPPEHVRTKTTPVNLICVARFVPRKRQITLLNALSLLDDLDFTCRFVGEGPTLAECREHSRVLGLQNRVDFCGRCDREEVIDHLRDADVFVLCSLWEGLPGSILEAMGVGVPVVATDVSGTCEVVHHAETGLLVPADDPQSLGAAIYRLASDPELRLQLARAAWSYVTQGYSFQHLVAAKTAYFERMAMTEAN